VKSRVDQYHCRWTEVRFASSEEIYSIGIPETRLSGELMIDYKKKLTHTFRPEEEVLRGAVMSWVLEWCAHRYLAARQGNAGTLERLRGAWATVASSTSRLVNSSSRFPSRSCVLLDFSPFPLAGPFSKGGRPASRQNVALLLDLHVSASRT
jgi:hypothetical protein